MKLESVVGLMGCLCSVMLMNGCKSPQNNTAENSKTLYVAPSMQDGVGVGPMTCLQVKESPDADYQLFYSPIEGFDYVPGYEYELLVDVRERDSVPADASRYSYFLKQVVSQTPAGVAIDSTAWEMTEYLSVSGTMDSRLDKSKVNLEISGDRISGHAGANSFFGTVQCEGTSIQVSATGSTMMMGTPELMAQEHQFLKGLAEARSYQIVGEELRLLNGDGQVMLKFKPRVEPGLVSTVWTATGINNGKGGVTSLIRGATVTIEFAEDGRVTGSAGCNRFNGSYELAGDSIQFSPLATTRKMCGEPEGVMDQEAQFLQALGNSSVYSIRDDSLELRNADGALQAKFSVQGH